MAFENKNLSVIAYANGFTLWHYVNHKESLKDICADGYFDRVYTLMITGDMIIINGQDTSGIRRIILDDSKVSLKPLD